MDFPGLKHLLDAELRQAVISFALSAADGSGLALLGLEVALLDEALERDSRCPRWPGSCP